MFWNDDLITTLSETAVEHLGPQGRYLEKANSVVLISLYSNEAGKFWYGDLDLDADRDSLSKIFRKVSEPIFVLPDMSAYDERSIAEMSLMKINS